MFVWLLVLCFCLCCCFGSSFVCFKLSHSLLFTQKLWRFSGLSERALDLLLGLCLGVPSISRLFNLDCRYPRDLLQPARKKKTGQSLRQFRMTTDDPRRGVLMPHTGTRRISSPVDVFHDRGCQTVQGASSPRMPLQSAMDMQWYSWMLAYTNCG